MRTREEIHKAIDAAIVEGEALRAETNSALASMRKFPMPAIATMLLGARCLRALRTVSALVEPRVDDQVAIIGRAISEAHIDVEYLNVSTVRPLGKGRQVELHPDMKVSLFATHKAIAAYRAFEGERKAEIARSAAYLEAIRLRKELRIERSTYWSGTSNRGMVDELLVKAGQGSDRWKAITALREIFEHLSFFTHSNPNDAPYLSQSETQPTALRMTDEYTHASILAFCATPGIGILWKWEEALNGSGTTRNARLYKIGAVVVPETL